MHRPPASATHVLADNRERYDELVGLARRRAVAGDAELTLRAATLAGNYGWLNPFGRLADPALERLVVDAVRGGDRATVDGTRETGRVLHVLSEGYVVGGHTRLAWRWMARDPRRSDVVLTNQLGPVPEALQTAVTRSGGRLHDLRASTPDLTARARALRSLMDQADLVVQHVHPYDVVALAAANLPGPRPPIVFENHAEHTYWLGLGAADLVSNYHTFSHEVSRGLRGIDTGRLGLLPIPLERRERSGGSGFRIVGPSPAEEVRRRLGLPADAVIGLSIAVAHKFQPMWGRGMSHLVDRVLTWCPKLVVVLVGPSAQGPWERVAARHPGRVHALGTVTDIDTWYAGADLYLDSYPSRSGTSVLEAALAGLPVVALADLGADDAYAQLYQADSPSMTANPRATTQEQYVTMVRALVDDPELRAERGSALRSSVEEDHCGERWSEQLEALYAQAREVTAADLDEYGDGVLDERYGAMLLAYTGNVTRSPEVGTATRPLADQLDDALQADLFALTNRGRGPRLSVRVVAGWEDHREWTTRLLALAGAHPRLAVSLPFAREDDARGSRSVALVHELLATLGSSPEDCGAVSIDARRPRTEPAVDGEMPPLDAALTWLEQLVTSPSWEDDTVSVALPSAV